MDSNQSILEWNEDVLRQLCSTIAIAFLLPVTEISRNQNSNDNLELRLRKIFEGRAEESKVNVIRLILEEYGKRKRAFFTSLINNEQYLAQWEEIVAQPFYIAVRAKLALVSANSNTRQIVKAFHDHLNCTVILSIESESSLTTFQEPCSTKNQNHRHDSSNSVRIHMVSRNHNPSPGDQEYHFGFNLPSDLITDLEFLELVKTFCVTGVQYLRAKLSFYNAVSVGDAEKTGKWAATFGQLVGSTLGGITSHLVVGNARPGSQIGIKLSDYAANKLGSKKYVENAVKCLKLFQEFSNNQKQYIDIFIQVFLDVFEVYEAQLVRIRSRCPDWELYIKLLSIETIGRITSYIKSEDNLVVNASVSNNPDCDFLRHFLVEAIVKGKSKNGIVSEILPNSLQIFDVTKPGFAIEKLGWRSLEVFSKPGIVDFDSTEQYKIYACDSDKKGYEVSNINLYGCRRLAYFECFEHCSDKSIKTLLLNARFQRVSKDLRSVGAYKYLLPYHFDRTYLFTKLKAVVVKADPKDLMKETFEIVTKTNFTHEKTYAKLEEIGITLEKLVQEEAASLKSQKVEFDIREGEPKFAGRVEEMDKLHKSLHKSVRPAENSEVTVVISGLGGIGKSELAIKYALMFKNEYNGNIIWINAGSRTLIEDSFKRLGHILQVKFKDCDSNMQTLVTKIYEILEPKKYLIIFDNVENEVDEDYDGLRFLHSYFPPRSLEPLLNHQGRFIITSRIRFWETIPVIPLAELNLPDSQRFIIDHCKDLYEDYDVDALEEDALKLGERLQGLPLALKQAIAFIRQADSEMRFGGTDFRYSIGQYLHELQSADESAKELLKYDIAKCSKRDGHQKAVLITYLMTMKRIQTRSPDSLRLLNYICFMLPDRIPSIWFRKNFGVRKLGACLKMLQDFSMISVHETQIQVLTTNNRVETELKPFIFIHRVLKDVIRLSLDKKATVLSINSCLKLLQEQLRLTKTEFTSLCDTFECISHVESVWNFAICAKDDDVICRHAKFAYEVAEFLFTNDREYLSLRFCQPLVKCVPILIQEFLEQLATNILELMTSIQKRLCKEFLIQERFVAIFQKFCMIRNQSKLHFLVAIHNTSRLLLKDTIQMLRNSSKEEFVVLNEIIGALCKNFEDAQVDRKSYSKCRAPTFENAISQVEVISRDVYSFMILLLFPLMSFDYCEEDLMSALKLFEYIQEKYENEVKSCPNFYIILLQCQSFCWFKLRARPAAVRFLRKAVRILISIEAEDSLIHLHIKTIKYLRTENEAKQIEVNLRSLIGIVKGEETTGTTLVMTDIENQLGNFLKKMFNETKKDVKSQKANELVEL